MPPKKGTSKGKKKKSAVVDAPPPPRPLYPPSSSTRTDSTEKQLLEALVTRSDLVFVRLKQADWSFSDFTVMVHASSPLHTLARKIEERHGRMLIDADGNSTLQLFRHPPNEKNILPSSEWHLRLDQLGLTGGTVEEQHSAIIYYNYTPVAYSALLQREPQLLIPAQSAEEKEALDHKNADHDFLSLDMHLEHGTPATSPKS